MAKTQINVGLIGLGVVGTGVARILLENAENLARRAGLPVVLKRAADLDLTRDRGLRFPEGMLTSDAGRILGAPDIDVVVEVIGGVKPARQFIETALKAGQHVVTSNKEVIAKHGREFLELARQHGVNVYYEAAAGGGIPIVHSLKNCLAANNIQRIYGIVNGTTNFILSKMHDEGADFSEVLREAQSMGFAEADPTADVDGYDVAYKLSILASISFNTHIRYEDIHFEGIRAVAAADIRAARQVGYVIKLLAIGIKHANGDIELRVHPTMIPAGHPLAGVKGSFNAIFVVGDYVDETMFYGRGAGQLPTASAIVGDIMDIAMAHELNRAHPSLFTDFGACRIRPMGEIRSEYYLRLTVKDEIGVLAAVSEVCRDTAVSIKSVQQRVLDDAGEAELLLITHEVRESDMQVAVGRFQALPSVCAVNTLIRVGV